MGQGFQAVLFPPGYFGREPAFLKPLIAKGFRAFTLKVAAVADFMKYSSNTILQVIYMNRETQAEKRRC